MADRKLATIRKIQEVKLIQGADLICAYRVDGWWVVDSVGKYAVGDLVVYAEPDSWVPTELAPFLSKGKEPRIYKGIPGERLRTIKLKKQISQGLILPFDIVIDKFCGSSIDNGEELCEVFYEGADVTDVLGIIKWEPEHEFRSADAKGAFPGFIPKTDQERIQNCYKEVSELLKTDQWLVEEKVEGQSSTIYFNQGEFGVASRNLDLKESDNTFWNTANKYNLKEKLTVLGRNIAIQSEQCGHGISGNIYGFTEYLLFVFDIFDIDQQKYLSVNERNTIAEQLGLQVVPQLSEFCGTISLGEILTKADGKSVLGSTGTLREGLVFRKTTGERLTFKAVSNRYLLNEK